MIDHMRAISLIGMKIKTFLVSDSVTGGVAIAAIISPAWLPMIQDISTYAALFMPILGVMWLAVQIVTKVYETFRNKKKR